MLQKQMFAIKFFLICSLSFCFPFFCSGYSVLTHEAIIDAAWDNAVKPLLQKKYPAATEDELTKARAFVYGGSIIPDLGYFPFGSHLFTNLIHYVRSGDFVEAMIDESKNLNEYAFGLGVLCHYIADNYGHPIGTNKAVPILFPSLKKKYGNLVTYEQNQLAHTRTEFGFDVLQTFEGDYKAQQYHDYLGFQISEDVLQRAFLKIYGLNIRDIFVSYDKAIGTFRWAVRKLLPELTRDAWKMKRTYFIETNPVGGLKGFVKPKNFIYRVDRKSFDNEYGKDRKSGGVKTFFLSFLIRVVPKIGPMKVMKFRVPNAEVKQLWKESKDSAIMQYSLAIKKLGNGKPSLANKDFDTGNKTTPGEYIPSDGSYCELLLLLQKQNFACVTPELKKNILAYFLQQDIIKENIKSGKWEKVIVALEALKQTELLKEDVLSK